MVAARPTGRRGASVGVAAGCVALATISLVVPASIAFDPWAWLVWGRELTELSLDTTGGPSWKPLPVLVAALLAPFGDLAPALWLVVARTAGLLAIVLTYRLAARFAGPVAGVLAGGALLLTPDGGPRFLRLLLEGHSATVEVLLVLWAFESHLDGHRRRALLVGTAMALLRPEAWPFLGVYGLWLWWRAPDLRHVLVAAAAAIPVLWFGADWWGSGDPWHGAAAAQVISEPIGERFLRSLDHVAKAVVAPAWVAAAVAIVSARRRHEVPLLVLGAGAVAWASIVVVMSTVLGYAALSRFLLPASAAVCVLAGIGAVRAVHAARGHAARTAVLVLVVLASLPLVGPRVLAFDGLFDGIGDRARSEAQLEEAIAAAGGPVVVRGCDQVVVERSTLPQAALAWRLDLPLSALQRAPGQGPRVSVLRVGSAEHRRLEATSAAVEELGRSEDWVVVAVQCTPSDDDGAVISS